MCEYVGEIIFTHLSTFVKAVKYLTCNKRVCGVQLQGCLRNTEFTNKSEWKIIIFFFIGCCCISPTADMKALPEKRGSF